jgi:hypothetical protein
VAVSCKETSFANKYFDDLRLKCLINEEIGRSVVSGWIV